MELFDVYEEEGVREAVGEEMEMFVTEKAGGWWGQVMCKSWMEQWKDED